MKQSRSLSVAGVFFVILLSVVSYVLAIHRLSKLSRTSADPELLVSLPRLAQVILAGGDRHLAANLAGFRVLIADTGRMSAEDYVIQGRLQRDIAWLNPAHEDNYYIAAAMLPWNGEVDAAEYVLRKASEARAFDWYPLFHYGFLFYHFRKDPASGAHWLLKGVPRVRNQQDQWALQNLAARWIEKGYQTGNAAGMVEAMAADSPPGAFRNYLKVRAARLRDLAALQGAAELFRVRHGKGLERLEDLVADGLVAALPEDPLGEGFGLDSQGRPKLNSTSSGAK